MKAAFWPPENSDRRRVYGFDILTDGGNALDEFSPNGKSGDPSLASLADALELLLQQVVVVFDVRRECLGVKAAAATATATHGHR